MIDYLKQNSVYLILFQKNFVEKHSYFERIMNDDSIVNSKYFCIKLKENISNFQTNLYNKLRFYFLEPNNNLYFTYYSKSCEFEDTDFEKDVVERLITTDNFNFYEHVGKFNEFIENQNRAETKFDTSNLVLPPTFETSPSANQSRKGTYDMEIDDLRTNISIKSFDKKSNDNKPKAFKKFAVFKNEICLNISPHIDKIKSKIPFLKIFNIKFTKRENIDKKIIRKFRKFLKSFLNKQSTKVDRIENSDFWIAFINEELYPPIKFRCLDGNRIYEFKSFNTSYMSWIFSVNRAEIFYNEFFKEKGEETFNSILKKNNRIIQCFNEEEKNDIYQQLMNYIKNLAYIFNINNYIENCEEMPPSKPNFSGDIYDEMLDIDVNAFFNEESHYNKKK